MNGDFSYLSNESLRAPSTLMVAEEDAKLPATDFVPGRLENRPINELRPFWGRTSFEAFLIILK